MKGVNYVTNDKNEKIAAQIDLNKYGDIWEDFYDSLISDLRKDEESISWEKAKEALKKEGKF